MKAYGYSRRDKLTCKYGCCAFKGDKHKRGHNHVDRARRKAGRRFSFDQNT